MMRSATNYEAFYWKSKHEFQVRLRTYRNFGYHEITEQAFDFVIEVNDVVMAYFRLEKQPF